jgi:hypothetical protein
MLTLEEINMCRDMYRLKIWNREGGNGIKKV